MYEADKSVRFLDMSKRLVAKYNDLLEGIKDDYTKAVTAILLENETTYLEGMDEATRLTSVGSFDKYVYPLIRRTYPALIVNDLVSVQPLTGPTGLIFYLKFNYGSNKGGITSGSEYLGANVANFDESYSSEYVNGESVATGAGAAITLTSYQLSYFPIRAASSDISFTVTYTNDSDVVRTATANSAGTLSGTGFSSGTVVWATGLLSLVTAENVKTGTTIKVYYTYNGEANTIVPEMDMDISKVTVEAKTRKLRSKWSPEAAQDLRNLHGLDAEVELVTILSQEIALETNHEVVMDLYNNTDSSASWSATPAAGVSYREHKDTFIDSLVGISNVIYSKTLRGEANFLVCSTDVSTVVETLPGFVPASSNPVKGIGFIGVLNNRWNIFKNPFLPANKAVIGYKGDSWIDTGYVYSPYVPLMATPTLQNADDFINRKGLMSRYAKKVINSKFYGVITKTA